MTLALNDELLMPNMEGARIFFYKDYLIQLTAIPPVTH